MDKSLRGLLLAGEFLEVKSLLEKDTALSLLEKSEIASQLSFQIGQLKDPAKSTLLNRVIEKSLLNFLLRDIFQLAELLFFKIFSIVNRKSFEKLEAFYLSNVIHYRYSDFRTGIVYASHLIAIAKINQDKMRYFYYLGFFGHFLALNGKTKAGIKLLSHSELNLKEFVPNLSLHELIHHELIHQYLSETSAMLIFHFTFIGDYKTSSMMFDNLLSRFKTKPYFWVESFLRSVRMNESLDNLNRDLLYHDITQMKKLLGPKNTTKFLLRTKIFSALMSATQGDLNLAKELLSELTLDYSSATSRIELGRFYLLLSLLSIEIGESEKAKNSILKAKIFFAEIPNAVTHQLDAELIGFEVELRSIPHLENHSSSKQEIKKIRESVLSIKSKCSQMPYFKLRCTVLISVSYFLEGNINKAQSILKEISDNDKQHYRRFFLSMSSIAPLGFERSVKELGIQKDVLINKNVMALFSEFLLGADTFESIAKLLAALLASREKVIVRIIEKSNIEKSNSDEKIPYFSFRELNPNLSQVHFYLKQKTVECDVSFPLSRPEWNATIAIQLNMISTILQYMENKNALVEAEKVKTFNAVARQVAHDIRSPLAALNSLLIDTAEVPESKRILLRTATNRINDIANNLIFNQKNTKSITHQPSPEKSIELISAVLDSLLSEKRIQHRNKSGVLIEGDLNSGYGLFAEIICSEFQRVISNLINNSIEAFETECGHIRLSIEDSIDSILISVADNGKGIPPELLVKLGTEEVTFGKENSESGSGLGVVHARKTIENFGGTFHIESTVNKGTKIFIKLPKAPAPNWFVNSINIQNDTTLVCLDDDQAIHQIWKNRFFNNKIYHFTSPQIFEQWWQSDGKKIENKIVLMDFEFLNHSVDGFTIIENLSINKDPNTLHVYIVSSHYEEQSLQYKADKLGVPIIPKGMAALIPIVLCPQREVLNAVLIDDDPLVRMTWELAAKHSESLILTFNSFEAFCEKADSVNPETPISVDVNLGNGVLGTEVAPKLHEMGFKHIYLATGYQTDSVENVPSCVSAVRGKDPIFFMTTNVAKNDSSMPAQC